MRRRETNPFRWRRDGHVPHFPVRLIVTTLPSAALAAVCCIGFSADHGIWLNLAYMIGCPVACVCTFAVYEGHRRLALPAAMGHASFAGYLLVHRLQSYFWALPPSLAVPDAIVVAPLVAIVGLHLFADDVVRRDRARCHNCGYDLRGTISADRTECPECGEPIPDDAFTSN